MPDFLTLSRVTLFLALAATAGVLLAVLFLGCRTREDVEVVGVAVALRAAPYHRIREAMLEGVPHRAAGARKREAE